MKKIPTLFVKQYENHRLVSISSEVMKGMEWVLNGKGVATVKLDGSCCAIINGNFFLRYDAKKGKNPPKGAISCCDPDPITGHWPHWRPMSHDNPADKWFLSAYNYSLKRQLWEHDLYLPDGTYEAIGPHFQSNPYNLASDRLEPHGTRIIPDCPRTFDGIKDYLEKHMIEGIVFWKDGEPQCKIKRSDFGFQWPVAGISLDERAAYESCSHAQKT